MELFDKRFVYFEWDDKLKGKEVFLGDTLPQLRVSANGHCDSPQGVSKNISDDSFYPFISPCGTRYAMVYYDPNYECKVAYAQGKAIQCRNKGDDNWIVTSNHNWVDRCEYRVKPEMWTACINDEGIVSVMPASECNKSKGRQLIEGTRDKCEVFAIENYCNRCAYHAACVCHKCTVNLDMWYCQGFKELKAVKKRRMTNRELAKWLAEGNGQTRDTRTVFTFTYYNVYDVRDDDKPCPSYLAIRGWDETEWHEPLIDEE